MIILINAFSQQALKRDKLKKILMLLTLIIIAFNYN